MRSEKLLAWLKDALDRLRTLAPGTHFVLIAYHQEGDADAMRVVSSYETRPQLRSLLADALARSALADGVAVTDIADVAIRDFGQHRGRP